MKDNKKTISFTDDNNEKVEFEVIEQTTITGITIFTETSSPLRHGTR